MLAFLLFRAYKTYDQLSFHSRRVVDALLFMEAYEVGK